MSKTESPNSSDAASSGARFSLSRLNQVLLFVLIVQGALIAYLFWPRSTAGSSLGAGDPLLGELAAVDVSAIEIADNSDALLKLIRNDDGWVLAETGDYPAAGEKIDEVLGKLLAINTDRLVTQTPGSHSRLQVAENEYNRRLTLTTPKGDEVLYLGSSAGAGASHVRAADQNATYLTGEIAAWELATQPSSWINPQYFGVPASDTILVSLENENGQLTFVRDEADVWTLEDLGEDEAVEPSSIDSLVNRLTSINLSSPLGTEVEADHGLDQPTATIMLTVQNDSDTASYTLVLGAKQDADKGYVLKSSDSKFYVTVPAFLGDEMAVKRRSDFLASPEAQEPQTEPQEDTPPATPEIGSPESPLPTPDPEGE